MSQTSQEIKTLRVVFMGTPDFAVPSLRRLLGATQVVGVFTQPDRPAGRGRKLKPSPVKALALEAGVPVHQPSSLKREPEAIEVLAALRPDLVVVAAYGLILPKAVLEAGPLGALNVHASILPRWRGAAPVAHAILAGDAQTGVCIMKMDEGLDTGAVISRRAIPITENDTAGSLTEALAEMGAELLVDTLPDWAAGEIQAQPQDDARSTYAPRLKKSDGRLDWREPADALSRRVRAMSPWPGAHTLGADGMLKIHAVAVVETEARDLPGNLGRDDEGFPLVAAGDGQLRLLQVQPAGGRAMSAKDFLVGRPELIGTSLGDPEAALEATGSQR
jgi:methionyl-tRNA formyltransferase